MSTAEIQSDAFARAALESERVRALGLLWSVAAIARLLAAGAPGEGRVLRVVLRGDALRDDCHQGTRQATRLRGDLTGTRPGGAPP